MMWGTSQIREAPPSDDETALCEALVEILRGGVHDLAGIVDRLETAGVRPEAGGAWTEQVFVAEMARLGDGPGHRPVAEIRY